MDGPEASEERAAAAESDSATAGDPDLARVREILLGGDGVEMLAQLRDLRAARERLVDDVSRVLPEAVLKRGRDDAELARALYPPVEDALETSVRRNPQVLIDVIFPVLGPAIRKAVRQAVTSMVSGLNRGVEYTFTLRGLRWRWEALRTRRSIAEVVLAQSLVYRVEEVFLFHRESGLPLQQVSELEVVKQDPALVTAMMTAIQDFVRDSFQGAEDGDLSEFTVGEHEILVEAGPRAVLACAVRGRAPASLRETMQEVLEQIHGNHARLLQEFAGDAEPFAVVLPEMERCLQSKERPMKRSPVIPVVTGLAIAGLGVWAAVTFARSTYLDARWRVFVEDLRAEPGIFVASAEKDDGRYRVAGLRDPLAADPARLLEESGLDRDRVALGFREWHAPDPELALRRFRAALRPPESTSCRLEDGVLAIEGTAPGAWMATVRRLAPLLAGVHRLDLDRCRNLDLDPLRRDLDFAASWTLAFAADRTALDEGARAAVAALSARLGPLDRRAAGAGAVIRLTVLGSGDEGVGELTRDRQARARAEAVRLGLLEPSWHALRVDLAERPGARPGIVELRVDVRDRVETEQPR